MGHAIAAAQGGKVLPFRHREPASQALEHYASLYAGAPEIQPKPDLGSPLVPWPVFDDLPTHPGHGLEPRTVNAVFRYAEMGALWRQADLFADIIESDGHLRSLLQSRRDAVAGCEWVIQPGAQDKESIAAATLLMKHLPSPLNVHAFLHHHLAAPHYGYSCSAILWEQHVEGVFPGAFVNVPHRRFLLASGNELEYVVSSTRSVPLAPGQWVVSRMEHENLARAGLLRTATWWSLFKRMSVRDWVVFAERFGVPFAIGIYEDRAGADSRKALEDALSQLGNAGQVVISDATKIIFSEVAQRAGDSSAVHPALIALCEAQMSKLINGATQNIEQGAAGSYAQARVHESRSFRSERADAKRVGDVFAEYVGVPFLRYNGFSPAAAPPRLHVQIARDYDPETRARVASILCNELGAVIDAAPIYDELGFREALDGQRALRGTAKPAASTDGPKEPADG